MGRTPSVDKAGAAATRRSASDFRDDGSFDETQGYDYDLEADMPSARRTRTSRVEPSVPFSRLAEESGADQVGDDNTENDPAYGDDGQLARVKDETAAGAKVVELDDAHWLVFDAEIDEDSERSNKRNGRGRWDGNGRGSGGSGSPSLETTGSSR